MPSRGGPSARHSHSAVISNGTIYVFGGIAGGQVTNDLYSYDLGTHFCEFISFSHNEVKKKWTHERVKGDPPPRRWGHSAVCRRGYMYIFGGHGNTFYNDVYRLNFGFTAVTLMINN